MNVSKNVKSYKMVPRPGNRDIFDVDGRMQRDFENVDNHKVRVNDFCEDA